MKITALRRLHNQLYARIEDVESEQTGKSVFRTEVEALLGDLMAEISDLEFLEDYHWVVKAIREWELYLHDSFGVIACQSRPTAVQPLRLRPRPRRIHHSRLDKFARILADLGVRAGYWQALGGELRSVVAAAVIVKEGRLLVQNLPRGPFEDYWGLPAAYVNFQVHEDPATVAMEKAQIAMGSSRGVAFHSEDMRRVLQDYSQESFCGLPTFIYAYKLRVSDLTGYPSADEEVVRWSTPEELLSLQQRIHPMMPELLAKFHAYLGSRERIDSVCKELQRKISNYRRAPSRLWLRNEEAARAALRTDGSLVRDLNDIVGPITKEDKEFMSAVVLVHRCFQREIEVIGASAREIAYASEGSKSY